MSKYSLGLDIGTNSVGWAVVDENNQLVKKNGYTLWGVRMFEEAQDASNTRSYRTDRRRLARRSYRINLLRDIFRKEIEQVDQTFFERLDDSFYKIEDKRNGNYHNLFNDTYTDKEFFKDFPTPYHLRKYLIESNEKADIRLLYLALHNMIKFRGNFLYQGETFNQSDDNRIREIFDEFNALMYELSTSLEDYDDYFKSIDINDEMFTEFKSIMVSSNSKLDKKRRLQQLFNVENKSFVSEYFIPLLIGSKCNFSSLTPVKEFKYEKTEMIISAESLESDIEEKKSKVPEFSMAFDFMLQIKEVVDYYFLIKLLENTTSLSEAMIKKYKEHEKDLKSLKLFIKKFLPKKYDECFRIHNDGINNYPKYIGMNFVSSKKPERFSHCSRDEFYSYILSLFKQVTNPNAAEEIKYYTFKIENNDFLLRQNSDQNGSLPMQLNLSEMIMILDKQSKYHQFLNDVDSNGISNKDKILSIFKFVVPYYVGPLNKNSKRSWLERTDEKIYPWNFDKVVNLDESATKFIENMQRKCTYLKGDDDYCLPKNSIIFSKYNCLSYLNKLSINGSLIPVDIKKDLFENVFLKYKKPTKKDIINYLKSNYGDLNITTTQYKELPEINCNMSSYVKFSEIFGTIDDKIDMIEHIIKDIVIFSDKRILEKRLAKVYNLDSEIIKKIKDINYKDYSNLSNRLLNGLKIVNQQTGEVYGTLLNVMENTNCNLQEVLYNQEYRLIDIIDEYNKDKLKDSNEYSIEEYLDDNIAVSPIMKRPLIQAHTIISEVKKILNAPIDKYYVECTRTNKAEKKKQTVSRYNHLKELYKNCKKLSLDLNVDFKELNEKLDKNQNNLKSDILYLYFTQLGKCMYTLENIDFDCLVKNNNKYDIDHIYPQSLIKDDSLSNRVLVLKGKNNEKQDNMLFELPGFLHKDAYRFYELLRENNLISKEKYNRLTKKEISSAELDTFVNRQLVSTNQAVKGLIQVLKQYDKVDPTDIIYSKAENISLARNMFDLPKSRLANNFHHAHDAYLNVVIGRAINTYFVSNHFNSSLDYYRFKTENKTTNVARLLSYNRYSKDKVIWDKEKTVNLIKKNLYERFDIHETTRCYNSNELFSKVTIKPAGVDNPVPIKSNDLRGNVEKYGGVTSYKYHKFVILENITKKNKKEYILEAIPTAFKDKVEDYLYSVGYNDFKIINQNIKFNVVVEYKSLKYAIAGKSGDAYVLKNLQDRYFNKYYITTIKKLEKYLDNITNKISMLDDGNMIIISPARNNECKEITLSKNELIDLYNEIIKKYSQNIYSYSIISSIKETMIKTNPNIFKVDELAVLNNELLKLLQTNTRKYANLKQLNLSQNSGKLSLSRKLNPGIKFIAESITGYYKKILFEVPE